MYRDAEKSGKAYNGRMINISAGGFAFSAHQEDFANAIGQDILLEIPDFPLEEARTLDGHIIRSTDNDGEFIVGCRMPEDSEEIRLMSIKLQGIERNLCDGNSKNQPVI